MPYAESTPVTVHTHVGGSSKVNDIGTQNEQVVSLSADQQGDAVLATTVLAGGRKVVLSATANVLGTINGYSYATYGSLQITTIDTSNVVSTKTLDLTGAYNPSGNTPLHFRTQMVALAGGGFVIAETSVTDNYSPTRNDNLYYEILSADGTVTKSWTKLNTEEAHDNNNFELRATADGGFAFKWGEVNTSKSYYETFSSTGGLLIKKQLSTTYADYLGNTRTVADGFNDGAFAVDTKGNVFVSLDTYDVFTPAPYQIYGANGALIASGTFKQAEAGFFGSSSAVQNVQVRTEVVALPDGSFLAVLGVPRGTYTQAGYAGYNMYVQKITVNGSTVTFGTPALVETTTGNGAPQYNPVVLSNGKVALRTGQTYGVVSGALFSGGTWNVIDPSKLPGNSTTLVSQTPLFPATITPAGTRIAYGDPTLASQTYTPLFSADQNGGVFVALQSGQFTKYNGVLDASLYAATIDPVLPAVFAGPNPSVTGPTNATSLVFTVAFSTAVTGVTSDDFTLRTSSGAVAAGTVGTPATSDGGKTYTVTVTGLTGNGVVHLDLNSSGTGIQDAEGNLLPNGGTTGGNVTLDHVAPTVASISPSLAGPTNATTLTETVTFSEAVTGVDSTDFVLATTGTATATVGQVTATGTPGVYTVALTGVGGDGTLRLTLRNSGTGIQDTAGNAVQTGLTGSSVTLDHTAPTVVGIVPSLTGPTNAATLTETVTFSEAVTGVDSSDFSVVGTGTATATIGQVTATGAPGVYTVALTGVGGDGTISLVLKPNGTGIQDTAGNAVTGGLTGKTTTLDHTAPTVSIIPSATGPTNAATLTETVTFSEAVTGVDVTDFVLATTGTATATISQVTATGTPGVYTVALTGVGGDGTLGLNLKPSGTGIQDAAGNAVTGSLTGTATTLDNTAPVVVFTSTGGLTSRPLQAVSGTAEANGTVTLLDGSVTVGTATVGTDGTWTTDVLLTRQGARTLTARQTDQAGNTGTATLGFLVNPAATDLDGDGTSDVLLQKGGTVTDLIIAGGVYRSSNLISDSATGYTVRAAGDLNADGTADLVLQNGGTVVEWFMRNGVYQSGTVLTNALPNGFSVVDTGDFNGDGTADILLQGGGTVVAWMVQNGQVTAANTLTTTLPSGFSIVGTGDFNGDGTADILLQNGGSVVAWLVGNGQVTATSTIAAGADGYTVRGTGDFNGDGTADIVLQNGNTVVDWIVKNGAYQSGNLITTDGADYTIRSTGDYNGDGTTDIIAQRDDLIVNLIMGGGTLQSYNFVPTTGTGAAVVPFHGNA